jgi:hypothetical protein
MKIPSVGLEMFHSDGQTDTTKLIVAFRNFAKAPKILRVRWVVNYLHNTMLAR